MLSGRRQNKMIESNEGNQSIVGQQARQMAGVVCQNHDALKDGSRSKLATVTIRSYGEEGPRCVPLGSATKAS